MSSEATRRDFLKASLGAAAAAALSSPAEAAPQAAPKGKMLRGVVWGMLPEKSSVADRFKMAADAGFDAVEAYTTPEERVAGEIKKAADAARIRITSVMNQAHWEYPLSSSDPSAIQKSIDGMKTSIRNAKLWGADAVLLVPGVVNPQTRYQEAWDRSQKHIREQLLPFAAENKIIIAVEEVWNKFLVSPIEFASYVDSFKSPWLKAYFDVGNVLLFGYPQDWIRTLGKRIVKVHLKDFKASKGFSPFTGEFVNLGEGDVPWPEVRKALGEIGYTGTVTAELDEGDLNYLTDVRKRIDKLVLGIGA